MRFRSHSATEVLVRLCEQAGGDPASVLKPWRGMFAFACFDRRTGRYFAERDRLGDAAARRSRADAEFLSRARGALPAASRIAGGHAVIGQGLR